MSKNPTGIHLYISNGEGFKFIAYPKYLTRTQSEKVIQIQQYIDIYSVRQVTFWANKVIYNIRKENIRNWTFYIEKRFFDQFRERKQIQKYVMGIWRAVVYVIG